MEKFRKTYTFDDVLLVPKRSTLMSRFDANLSTYFTPKIKLQLPIGSMDMDTVTESEMAITLARLGGIGIIHRFNTPDEEAREVAKVKKENLPVGASLGVKPEELERAEKVLKAGADFLAVWVAHAHHENVALMMRALHKKFPKVELVVGNVATAEGFKFLVKEGAAAVRIGIGNGTICITRVVTGFGVPQLTALMDCADESKKYGVPMISDGGLNSSGGIVKALAAGASAVTIGSLLAGTDESPGKIIVKDGKKYKVYRGMASREANRILYTKVKRDLRLLKTAAEGVEGLVPYKGSVVKVLEELAGGIRSGVSYGGGKNIQDLQRKAEFIEVSQSGWKESQPHDVLLK